MGLIVFNGHKKNTLTRPKGFLLLENYQKNDWQIYKLQINA
jgi:hypothetical protein